MLYSVDTTVGNMPIHSIQQFLYTNTQYNLYTIHCTIRFEIQFQDYFEYFAPDYTLHPDTTTKIENQNTRTYLDNVMTTVEETLRNLSFAPSVQMQEVRVSFPCFSNYLFIHSRVFQIIHSFPCFSNYLFIPVFFKLFIHSSIFYLY